MGRRLALLALFAALGGCAASNPEASASPESAPPAPAGTAPAGTPPAGAGGQAHSGRGQVNPNAQVPTAGSSLGGR